MQLGLGILTKMTLSEPGRIGSMPLTVIYQM
jgi:hypothetical protein